MHDAAIPWPSQVNQCECVEEYGVGPNADYRGTFDSSLALGGVGIRVGDAWKERVLNTVSGVGVRLYAGLVGCTCCVRCRRA